jgi:hypothetical protein
MYKVLILESELYHKRANVINPEVHFPDCDLQYNGIYKYSKGKEFFYTFDLVVSVLYLSPTCNYIINKCKGYGVKTMLLTDGLIEWSNMFNNPFALSKGTFYYHPIYHDYFAIMGSKEKEYFNSHSQVKAIDFTPNRILKDMRVKKNKNGDVVEGVVLLTTANNPYFNQYEKSVLIKLLLLSQNHLIENNQPYKSRVFDQEIYSLLADNDSQITNDILTDFDTCMSDVSHVITTPSTIVISAMLKGVPVCQLIYRNEPVFLQSGWSLNTIQNIDMFFGDFLLDNPNKINFQNATLNEYVRCESLLDQVKTHQNELYEQSNNSKNIEKNFVNDNFILNFEPLVRSFNEIVKQYLPSSIKKVWLTVFKKLR